MTDTTPEGTPAETLEDSVAVAAAVEGDTTVTPPLSRDGAGAPGPGDGSDDPATPEFVEPVPPDGT